MPRTGTGCLDALVIELASNRNAIYKALFDARRKLRVALECASRIAPSCASSHKIPAATDANQR